ncbi:MAG: protein phosphatase 2C domain-containing protein [Xenococcaceae cyanobacterium MO_188.B19]|nr:protein phosphatase 2C domain-containing protein [Xenococcaceae cyanobacterium MO_188.B19]
MKRVSQPKISMLNPELQIQCSSSHCQAFNAFESRFCKRCKTPVIKRYLWSIEPIIFDQEKSFDLREEELSSRLIGDRYFPLTDQIFLDTKPGSIPQIPEDLPSEIVTYLKLSAYSPHIPQVYGQLDGTDIWLLNYGTVPIKASGTLIHPQLIPSIEFFWSKATPQKQLNLLLQTAKLWKPLKNKGVASTLLKLPLLRVNGPFLQILQLEQDKETKPTLQQLGNTWSKLTTTASPTIQELLTELCLRLENRTIEDIGQVIILLNRALEIASQSQEYSAQIFARTDSGPNRENNEDAAYPISDSPKNISHNHKSLAIVCDGVGGHDGGEIASGETIEFLQSRISKLHFAKEHNNPEKILQQLITYINEANDSVNQRNDSEQRQERQRMGTTLVMTLARNHELYFTHVGDSRIYWITKTGCHQITTDDDLASREVRLGYAVYLDALQYPSAGALIQALGMRESATLHPNAERLVIDDDCLFLLCSDGLSDFDRIEQYWRSIALPVLNGKGDITKAVHRFVKLANERNGHDNVTIALVHYQVKSNPEVTPTPILWSQVESAIADSSIWSELNIIDDILPDTQYFAQEPELVILEKNARSKKSGFLSGKLIILGLLFLVGAGILVHLRSRENQENSSPTPENTLNLSPTFPEPDRSKEVISFPGMGRLK